MNAAPLLGVEHLTMRFGGLLAVDELSFAVAAQEITAIIGPNGAGKTTVFNCLTGFYRPSAGRLELHRAGNVLRLERMDGCRIARDAGVARTFQNIRLFAGMTVLENLIIAQHNALMRASFYTLGGLFGSRAYRAAEAAALDKARYWLDRVGAHRERRSRRRQPALRRAAPARDRARHVHGSDAALPRRAGGGPQSARIRRAQPSSAVDPRSRTMSASC